MDSTRDGVLLLTVGCLPFVGGALLTPGGDGTGIGCPFRALTGLPCPMCGATRAFVFFMHGNGAFVHYNAPWIAIFALLTMLGALALSTRRAPVVWAFRTPGRALTIIALLCVVPWIYALTERATIVS